MDNGKQIEWPLGYDLELRVPASQSAVRLSAEGWMEDLPLQRKWAVNWQMLALVVIGLAASATFYFSCRKEHAAKQPVAYRPQSDWEMMEEGPAGTDNPP